MIIDCISDLHGHYPKLEGGDLLIIAGDLTAKDSDSDWVAFEHWIYQQDYKEKIIIAGNHDNFLASMDEHRMWKFWEKVGVTYLCDSGTEFEGLKIWGSPWTPKFIGQNPHCMAFCCEEDELCHKWDMIPSNVDILVTHGPPLGILDEVEYKMFSGFVGDMKETTKKIHKGSRSLYGFLKYVFRPFLHVFGHIHEGYGREEHFACRDGKMMQSVNASFVNDKYEPVNKPIRVIL